jgi:hypothetical protein
VRRRVAIVIAIGSFGLLVGGCGGASSEERLSAYFGRVQLEQTAYRQAQKGALHAMDLIGKQQPTAGDCRASARLMRSARDEYTRLGTRMHAIEAPGRLRVAHDKLTRSLGVYARFFNELQQAIGFCSPAALVAEDASPLPDQAQRLRSDWRNAVTEYARQTGVELPGWATEVGRAAATGDEA